MLVLLVIHPRKQGWHDLAVKAVVIKERVLAPPQTQKAARTDRQAVGTRPSRSRRSAYEPAASAGGRLRPAPVPAPSPVGYGPQARLLAGARTGGVPSTVDPAGGRRRLSRLPPPYPPVLPQSRAGCAVGRPGRGRVAAADPAAPQSTGVTVRVRRRSAVARDLDWEAVLDDGRRLTVDGLVLLGRNPQPQPGEEDAQLIKIADETRTVSKLHLAIGVDEAGLYVVDRGSTNGSTVTNPSGQSRRCCPGRYGLRRAPGRSCRWVTTGWRSGAG